MFKMIANRGSGKTTSLMYHADLLAKENPDKQVLFVTSQPQLMAGRFLELSGSDHLPQNLGFISYSYFLVKIKDLKIISQQQMNLTTGSSNSKLLDTLILQERGFLTNE